MIWRAVAISRDAFPVDSGNHDGATKLGYQRHVTCANAVVPGIGGHHDDGPRFSVQMALDVSGGRGCVHLRHCILRKYKLQVEIGVFVNDSQCCGASADQAPKISESAKHRMCLADCGRPF